MLLRIPALLSPAEVGECREALLAAEWEDGRATAGHQATRVKSNRQLPLASPVGKRIGDLILDRLGRSPLFIAAVLPRHVLPPRFNRYEGEGAYGSHIDNALIADGGTYVRTDVSSTLFLSDPDDYDGGELVIEGDFGAQTIKLPAGDMAVYPGTSLHRVNPVSSGVRLAAFFWTQSLVPSDLQRRTLFELDEAIQRLATDHPDHASVAGLTGVYHNLLRQWSVT